MYADLADFRRFAKGADSVSDIDVVDALGAAAQQMDVILGKAFYLPIMASATASVVLASVPADAATLTGGDKVYRIKDTMAQASDILRAGTTALCAQYLDEAINEDAWADGTHYYSTTTVNGYFKSVRSASTLALTARKCGSAGNNLPLSGSSAAFTVTSFSGGVESCRLLAQINVDLAHAGLIRGRAASAQGGSSTDFADTLRKDALADLEAIVKSRNLVLDGGTAAVLSGHAQMDSTTRQQTPFSDFGDPLDWADSTTAPAVRDRSV